MLLLNVYSEEFMHEKYVSQKSLIKYSDRITVIVQ